MEVMVKGSKLVIEVECGQDVLRAAPQTSSGKSCMIATTSGFVAIPQLAWQGQPIKLSLNLILPLPKSPMPAAQVQAPASEQPIPGTVILRKSHR